MSSFSPPAIQAGNNQKIRLRNARLAPVMRDSVRQVMASPPTVSWSTSNTITGRSWPSTDGGSASSGGNPTGTYFSYTRAGGIKSGGASFPYYLFAGATSVNNGTLAAPGYGYNVMSCSFIYTGTAFSIYMQGFGQNVLLKVDDQYVSMTAKNFANDGSANFGAVTFAAAGRRRIEIIFTGGSAACFGGIFTAATDTVQPANIRGPRCIFVTDSFGQNPGSGSGAAASYPVVFGEFMGWDDVWSSAVGGTGFLANASGAACTYRQRLATDVIPWSPDIVCFQGSVNDSSYSAAQIQAEAALCFQQIQQGNPNALILAAGPMLSKGASYAPTNLLTQRAALKNAVQAVGGIFLDVQQQPLRPDIAPQTVTLTSAASAGATTLYTTAGLYPYVNYQFADGSQVLCTASSGGSPPFSNTVDICANAQASGAALTEVGACLWIGNGYVGHTTGVGNCDVAVYSDGVHPTQLGSEMIAETMAYCLMNQLYSN